MLAVVEFELTAASAPGVPHCITGVTRRPDISESQVGFLHTHKFDVTVNKGEIKKTVFMAPKIGIFRIVVVYVV